MHTFFLRGIPEVGAEAELDRRERDHLFKTLRCRTGEILNLCDGRGTLAEAEATAAQTVRIRSRTTQLRDRVQIHLYTALPRSAKLDVLLKPAAEAGVTSITPLKCRYSVAEKSTPPERWTWLLEEGCKQSGNPFLPELSESRTVSEALAECVRRRRRIFYGAQQGRVLNPAEFPAEGDLELAWFVGPEGGFAPEELTELAKFGAGITVGRYIFRLENAALAGAVYVMMTARAALHISAAAAGH